MPDPQASPGFPHIRGKLSGDQGVGVGVPFTTDFANWVRTGRWEHVNSSNVAAIAYDTEKDMVKIRYKDGSEWGYWPIPLALANGLYRTGSKGIWVWDYLKVRGKGNNHAHQVNARRL